MWVGIIVAFTSVTITIAIYETKDIPDIPGNPIVLPGKPDKPVGLTDEPGLVKIPDELLNSKCPGVTFNAANLDQLGEPIFGPESANGYKTHFNSKTVEGIQWMRNLGPVSNFIPAPPETVIVLGYVGSETGEECPD